MIKSAAMVVVALLMAPCGLLAATLQQNLDVIGKHKRKYEGTSSQMGIFVSGKDVSGSIEIYGNADLSTIVMNFKEPVTLRVFQYVNRQNNENEVFFPLSKKRLTLGGERVSLAMKLLNPSGSVDEVEARKIAKDGISHGSAGGGFYLEFTEDGALNRFEYSASGELRKWLVDPGSPNELIYSFKELLPIRDPAQFEALATACRNMLKFDVINDYMGGFTKEMESAYASSLE